MEPNRNWDKFYTEGAAYHARAKSGAKNGTFTPEVIHGLASMAIEKYLMALLLYNGVMPEGHTFSDLMRSSKLFADFGIEIDGTLDMMDSIQPLCTLDPSPMAPVYQKDVAIFMSASDTIRKVVDAHLPGKAG